MKLISEIINPEGVAFNDYEVIMEQSNKNTPMKLKVKGVFISCDVKNVNGRIYEFNYMNEDVIPEYDRVWISQHRAYGELNHAQSHVVDPKNACFLIDSLTPEGKNFIGEAIVLNSDSKLGTPGTPNGDILAAILLHGGKMGVSTRGAVEDPQNNVINRRNKYALICVDSVLDPSGVGCYINDVVTEEKDYMINEHGIVVECAYNNLENTLKKYTSTPIKEDRDKFMFDTFKNFLNDLNK